MTEEEEKTRRDNLIFEALLKLIDSCEELDVESLDTVIVGSTKSFFISIRSEQDRSKSESVH